jgi:hypothetical protein
VLNHGCPSFLWQRAIHVILAWFAGRTWKNDSYTYMVHLDCLNGCEFFVVYTLLTKVAAGRTVQPGGPRVGEPCVKQQ